MATIHYLNDNRKEEENAKERLMFLFKKKQEAWNLVQNLGLFNVAGQSPETMVEFDIVYQAAKEDFVKADRKYHQALMELKS